MGLEDMRETARALVALGKGVLAADESTPTMAKRLAGIGLESTEARRRTYREILFGTDGLSEHIHGNETTRRRDMAIRQQLRNRPFMVVLEIAYTDLRDRNITVYLCLPGTDMHTLFRWPRVIIQQALRLLVLDLEIRERGEAARAPVDEALGAIDEALIEEAHEGFAHRDRQPLVHREALAIPVERGAHHL